MLKSDKSNCVINSNPNANKLAVKYSSKVLSYRVGCDAILNEAGELLLVQVLVLLHKIAHILRDVLPHDVLPVNLRIKLLTFSVVAWEPFSAEKESYIVNIPINKDGTYNFLSCDKMCGIT